LEHPEFEQYYPDLANSKKLSFMSPKKKPKKEVSKTTLTAPTPSESTKIFEKRITGSTYLSPYPTKYSMSSKDWKDAFDSLDTMMSEEQGRERSSTSKKE
tara:strand:- start:1239 stop:1538 length:300 start_codon:yes stop_codon:yes gene_type:complete